jgi:hypothetical protein
MFRWIRLLLLRWVTGFEEYWLRCIPDAFRIRDLADGVVKKDRAYYAQIAEIMNNTAFLNELAELQRKLEQKSLRYMSVNKTRDGAKYAAMSDGAKHVNAIIINAKVTIDKTEG